MSFSRYFEIFVNSGGGSTGALLQNFNNAQAVAPAIQWVQNDIFEVRLRFGNPGATILDALAAVDAGTDELILAGKAASNLSAEDLLFSATGFTKVVTGADIYYTATLDLTPTALKTALDAAGGTLKCRVDIKDTSEDNTRRITLPQFEVTILEAVYQGTEGAAETGNPLYPLASAIELIAHKAQPSGYAGLDAEGKLDPSVIPAEAARFHGGFLQVLNKITGKWHSVFADGEDGAADLQIEKNGEE